MNEKAAIKNAVIITTGIISAHILGIYLISKIVLSYYGF